MIIPLMVYAQGPTPGQNVNMVSGTKVPDGDPFLQRQNESSIAVSSRNVCHLLAGANDYRNVDLNFFATGETGDAWLGLFKSFDCGATWQSTLFPGYRLDLTPEGNPLPPNPPNPLKSWNAASDPVVRSGPSGFFGYSGIAFNRGTNNGVVFFGRLVDLNNKENGTVATGAVNSNTDAIRFLGTTVVAKGSATRFLDKPWMAIDVARLGGGCNLQVPLQGGSSVTQTVAVGNIYVAFTAFNYNQMGTLISSQILFSRSADCGTTWSTPTTLSASDNSLNQGATIAIDPQTGFVYVAWRRFGSPNRADAIVAVASISAGQWFTPAIPVITLPKFDPVHPATGPNGPFSFFDQGTTSGSMRMDAFPSLAVADSGKSGIPGQIYLAWAQRGVGPKGEARIVLASSPDCVRWLPPFPIDNGAILDDRGNSFLYGHQFSPQLTFSGGKLVALFYDLRLEDHSIGTFEAVPTFPLPDSLGRFVLQTRNQCAFALSGVSLCSGDPLQQVVTPYLNDAGLTGRRHTLGVTMAQFDPQTAIFGPGAFKTAQVSQFPSGTRGDGTSFLQQLQFNVPNLPIFMGGTAPFLGDYLDIAGPMFALKNGSWVYSTGPSTASAFHATWTDNRDIKPPLDGDWTKYAPVNLDGPQQSVFDPTQNRPSCLLDANGSLQHEGERNQNIYTSQITQGLRVSSPQDSKPLSATLQRAFVVFVQNFTSSDRSFRLAISSPQPTGGFASFAAGKNNPPNAPTPPSPVKTSLDVTIAAHSGVVRSVFAVSSQTAASITVTATEIARIGGNPVAGGLSSFIVLNADPLNPALTNPDGAPAGSDINTVEIYEPNLHTPNLHTDNITDPNLHTPNLHTDTIGDAGVANALATPTNLTNVFNLSIADPNLHTPNLHTDGIAAPNLHTPNLHTVAPSSAMTDATYVFSDTGNTTASYHVRLVGNDPGIPLQVIVTNYYATPVAANCKLALQPAHSVLATASNAVVQSPASFNPADTGITDGSTGNVTFTVPPGGIVLVTMRANVDENTMQNSILSKVAPFVVPHAANTNDTTNTPKFIAPPFISTSTLPDGVVTKFYSTAVQAIGGTPPYRLWSVSAGSLPGGLNLSLDTETGRGLISGFPTTAATFTFTVQVSDSAMPPNTASRQFNIRVADPLTITTSPSLAETVGAPFTINLTSAGGIAPINWRSSNLPIWLNLTSAGALSGTAPAAGTFPSSITATDSASPTQSTTQDFSLQALPPTFLSYAQQPSNSSAGQFIAPPVQVLVQDNAGAVLPAINITMSLGTAPSGAVLSGTLTQTTDNTGVATFADLKVNQPGTYNLVATSPVAASSLTSRSFSVAGFVSTASPMSVGRVFHTANLLRSGQVLVVGGQDTATHATNTYELYDPGGQRFFHAAPMVSPRAGHAATLINSGFGILVTGGQLWVGAVPQALNTTEIYDPGGLSVGAGPNLLQPRVFHTATLLDNFGNVLIAGGRSYDGAGNPFTTNMAEILNAFTGAHTPLPPMSFPREMHTATLLPNGRVLLFGGRSVIGGSPFVTNNNADVYDPLTQTFTPVNFNPAAYAQTATLLGNGLVLLAGGLGISDQPNVETFDFSNFSNAPTGNLNTARHSHAAALLSFGLALVSGGSTGCGAGLVTNVPIDCGVPTASTELFDASTRTFSPNAFMGTARSAHAATLLNDGTVLMIGGWAPAPNGDGFAATPTAERYIPVAVNPQPPTNLTSGPVSSTSVSLSWTPSTSTGVLGYNVYRGAISRGPYQKIGSPNSLSFADTTVSSGTTYYYVVTAFGLNNIESVSSNEVLVIVP